MSAPLEALADVTLSPDMHGLLLLPRDGNDRQLKRTLSLVCPQVLLKRTSEGFLIELPQAFDLLSVPTLAWSSGARRFADNRAKASKISHTLRDRVNQVKQAGALAARRQLAGLVGIETLDDHQLVNVAAMTLPDSYGLCVFDEQGAGKTVTFIFAFDHLANCDEVDFALIVAPKSMVGEWPSDFQRFKGDLYKVATLTGSRQMKSRTLASGADVIVTNFENAVSMELELRALLRHHRDRAVLVVDESFFIKNPSADRTRAVRRLREWCGRAFVLCGTPAPNAPQDIVEQLNFVDFGTTFHGVPIPDDRDGARPVVQTALQEHGAYVRHLKSDVLPNLPGKAFERIQVQLEPIQAGMYQNLLQGLIHDLRSATDAQFRKQRTAFLARRIALLQICSNPVALEADYREIPAKLLALDGLLKELIEHQGDKVVIWPFFTASLTEIVRRFQRFNPVRYDGSVASVEERRDAVRRFQEDNQTMLFVGNPAAGGAGLTLHRARVAIYESLSNQAAHYLQSLDRIHRRGQQRAVKYLVLLADKSIELSEYETLVKKERWGKDLLGDPHAAIPTRTAMLSEALSALTLWGEQ